MILAGTALFVLEPRLSRRSSGSPPSRIVSSGLLPLALVVTFAVAVLIFEGVVNWGYGIPMIVGGLIGAYVGGMVSNRAPRRFLRSLVIVIGFGVSAYYFWNVYGASIPHIGGE